NVSGGARMNISGNGSFVAPTSNLGNINFWITNNAIQAYGGKGTINVDTNSQSGKIVLTAVAPDCHWTGSVSSDWAGAGNWDTDPLLPSAPWINAIINPSSNRPTVSTLGNTAKDLYLSPNASLAVTNGGSLTVGSYVTGEWGDSGTTDVSGGLLQAANLLLGNGGFDGKINISGGSVLANYLSINVSGGARMNISGNGSFVAPTSNLGNIKYWIEHHAIQAYGGSGAVRIDTTSQAGKIVLTALVSGYSSWAANNAPSGNAADDYDNDGVSNGVECVLGGALNTNDSAKLPQLSIMGGNVIFTFVRDQASIPGTT
ncbi:MAG: hypothetical protein EB056_07290, partial [Verrucomicrobia bacterium]|nr:hypothetical protein [Verrucomicrobiota bacterium]